MEEKYIAYFKRDNFARENGFVMTHCSPGHAIAQVAIGERHLNGAGVVHGGLLFSLADFAFAGASNSFGKVALSINASITNFHASKSGIITAEAKVITKSNKLIHCNIDVVHESGQILANFKGTVYVTKTEIEF